MNKTCTKCKGIYPATPEFFHRKLDGRYKDSLYCHCKTCVKEYNNNRRDNTPEKKKKRDLKTWVKENKNWVPRCIMKARNDTGIDENVYFWYKILQKIGCPGEPLRKYKLKNVGDDTFVWGLIETQREFKKCSTCKIELPNNKEYFFKKGDGLNGSCKKCELERRKKYPYNVNKEKAYTWRKNFEIKHPGFRRARKRLRELLQRYTGNCKMKKYGITAKHWYKVEKNLGPCPGKLSEYDVDHIFPAAAFDFKNPTHVVAFAAPENHRWLLHSENSEKSSSFDTLELERYIEKFNTLDLA